MSDKTLDKIPKVTSLDNLKDIFGCSWSSLLREYLEVFPNKTIKVKLVESNAYGYVEHIVYFGLDNGTSYDCIERKHEIRGITRTADKFEILPQYSIKALYER